MGPRTLEIHIIPASDGTVVWAVSEKERDKETERGNINLLSWEAGLVLEHSSRFYACPGIKRSVQLGSVLLLFGGKKSERKECPPLTGHRSLEITGLAQGCFRCWYSFNLYSKNFLLWELYMTNDGALFSSCSFSQYFCSSKPSFMKNRFLYVLGGFNFQ